MKRFLAAMNTTAARLSALYLILFSVCAVFLVIYMTGIAARFIVTETRNSIVHEVNTLDRVFRRGGMRALVRDVERRGRAPGANLYIITDRAGRILAGNVLALEPGVIDRDGWTGMQPFVYARFGDDPNVLRTPDRAPKAIAQVIALPNGLRMLVGRDVGEPERFRIVVSRALTMALLIMGLGGLLIWLFVGRRALRRIDSMSKASARIMAGDLTGRLPVSRANDEFDRLSSSLNTMLERISLLNDGLRDVSDSIAHDLKTPLTRLRNKAAQAIDSAQSKQAMQEAVTDIMNEADQLIRVFNALLLISRVEAGYSKQNLEPIDVSAIAQDMAELFGPTAEDAGFAFETEIEQGLITDGNRELIGQALTNVIENGIKYGQPEDGQPRLKLTVAPARNAGSIHVIIEDSGAGVPEADRERVTQRFVRLDDSRTAPGSGLGLSLVSAIMALHGGELILDDAQPGLRVTLSFPRRRR